MVLHTITRNEEAVFFSPQFIYLHDYKIQWKMLISFSLSLCMSQRYGAQEGNLRKSNNVLLI